jgi:hypothetical protein
MMLLLLMLLLMLMLLLRWMAVAMPWRTPSTTAATTAAAASIRARKRGVVLVAAGGVREAVPVGRRGRRAGAELRQRGRGLAVQRPALVLVRLGERATARC